MSPSRREFLRNSALASAGIALVPHVASPSIAPVADADAAVRPLLCDAADIARMRRTVQLPRFAAYWHCLLYTSDAADE